MENQQHQLKLQLSYHQASFHKVFWKKLFISFFVLLSTILSIEGQNWELSNHLKGSKVYSKFSKLNGDNNLYIFGEFETSITYDGVDYLAQGNKDLFLIKIINSTGKIENIHTIGNSSIDNPGGIAIDDTGNVYITGSFAGTCYFTPSYTLVSSGSYDFYLAKYSSTGQFQWAKNIGKGEGSTIQLTSYIEIDENQDIILTGAYRTDLIIGDITQDTLSGDPSIYTNFISKLDINGNVIWTKTITGLNTNSNLTRINNISINLNALYFGGTYRGTNYFDIDTITSNGNYTDNFLYKTDLNGDGIWLRTISGSSIETFRRLRIDKYNNLYLMGNFQSSVITIDSTSTLTVTRNKIGGDADTYLAKYNRSGRLQWIDIKGGNSTDLYSDFQIRGDIIYAGGLFADQIIFNNDTLNSRQANDEDAFLAAFNNKGDAISGINIITNDTVSDFTTTVTADSNLRAYISGYFNSDTIIIGDSTYINSVSDGTNKNMFFARYAHPFKATITDEQNVSCNGLSDGMLTVTPYFGVQPYTYDWSHDAGLNDSVATGLSAGIYTIDITDARDSTTQVIASVSEPDPLNLTLIQTETTCYNGSDGAIDLTVSGGTPSYDYEWTGGTGVNPTSEDQSGLVSDWFYVNVTDANGCEKNDSVLVGQPDKITFGGSVVTPSSGPGAYDGKIDLVVKGGTGTMPDFTYSWTGPSSYTSSDDSISGLEGGDYNLTVEDLNSCPQDTSFVISETGSFVAYIDASTNVTCKGDSNGTASAYVESGTGPYSYNWTDSLGTPITTNDTATGLAGGWYYVTIEDDNLGAPLYITDSIYIEEASDSIQINKTVVNPTCYGDDDGYVDINVTGGIPNYDYLWSNGKTTEDITGLSYTGDTLYVTVTDAHGCTEQNWAYIVDPPQLTVNISLFQSVQCKESLTGELFAFTSGGTTPYGYQWDDPGSQTEQLATELNAGMYMVTVTDYVGCIATDSYNLPDADTLKIDTIIGYDAICYGQASGAIKANVSGASGDYTYTWGHTSTDSDTLSNQLAGYYTLTVDDLTCNESDTGSVIVGQPDTISIVSVDTTHVDCYGDNTGVITVNVTGGTGSYNYLWGHDITNNTPTASSLTAGNYNVTISDAEISCSDSEYDEILIHQGEQLIIASVDSTNVSCNGDSDGSIIVTPSGGYDGVDYRFVWSHNGSLDDSSATSLSAGPYTVTVYDDVCSDNVFDYFIIEEPEALSIVSIDSIDVTCNGDNNGSIVVTPTGGSIGIDYRFKWSHNGSLDDSIASSLFADNYVVTIYDDACSDSISDLIIIEEPDALSIADIDSVNVTCNGGNDGLIIVTPTGGSVGVDYRFEWSHNGSLDDSTASSLVADVYTVTVYDDACSDNVSDLIIIEEPDPLSILSVDSTNVSCNGGNDGSITITPSGGSIGVDYRYAWSHDGGLDDSIATSLEADNYMIMVFDDVCSDNVSRSVIISEPNPLSIASIDSTDVTCNGGSNGSIIVTPSGGSNGVDYRFEWSHNGSLDDSIASSLVADVYTVTVYDDACSDNVSDLIMIEEPETLSILSIDSTDVTCNGGNNGSIVVTPTGGGSGVNYRYVWSHNGSLDDSTASSLVADIYTVTVYDDLCGTNVNDLIIINEPDTINLNITQQLDNECQGEYEGAITVEATGGSGTYTFKWSHDTTLNSNSASNLLAGNYNITCYDDACSDFKSQMTEILEPDSINIDSVVVTPIEEQYDGEIIVYASGGTGDLLFALNGSIFSIENVFSDLNQGEYTVLVTDDNGCGPKSSGDISVTTAIDLPHFNNLRIYPNPAKEYLIVESDEITLEDYNINLVSSLGQLVWKGEWKNGEKKLVIELENISKGLYYILIDDKKVTQPVIIQNY